MSDPTLSDIDFKNKNGLGSELPLIYHRVYEKLFDFSFHGPYDTVLNEAV